MNLEVGLLNLDHTVFNYTGYRRQPLRLERFEGLDAWMNSETITFPVYVDPWSQIVSSAGVFGPGGLLFEMSIIRLTLSSGITPRFEKGSIYIDNKMLEAHRIVVDTRPSTVGSSLPTNCKRCNHFNEYVGLEHLTNGEYICRSCR